MNNTWKHQRNGTWTLGNYTLKREVSQSRLVRWGIYLNGKEAARSAPRLAIAKIVVDQQCGIVDPERWQKARDAYRKAIENYITPEERVLIRQRTDRSIVRAARRWAFAYKAGRLNEDEERNYQKLLQQLLDAVGRAENRKAR